MVWLAVALFVDGIDGSLARWARVKEKAPRIDGDTLDLVIDYLTFVLVPTLFLWRAELIPLPLAPWLAGAILISSLYVFARTDMKTDGGYFRGFPALWNLVAFYLFVLQVRPATGAIVVVILVAATFAPIHFVHPFRVREYGKWLPALTAGWASDLALLSPALANLQDCGYDRLDCVAAVLLAPALRAFATWRERHPAVRRSPKSGRAVRLDRPVLRAGRWRSGRSCRR